LIFASFHQGKEEKNIVNHPKFICYLRTKKEQTIYKKKRPEGLSIRIGEFLCQKMPHSFFLQACKCTKVIQRNKPEAVIILLPDLAECPACRPMALSRNAHNVFYVDHYTVLYLFHYHFYIIK